MVRDTVDRLERRESEHRDLQATISALARRVQDLEALTRLLVVLLVIAQAGRQS